MFTKILHKPVSIAHQVVGGVARTGLHGAAAVVRRFLPDDETRTHDTSPKVSTEPVHQPPSPTTTTKQATTNTMPAKKARAKRAATKKPASKKTAPKKAASKKATPKKPASTLDEGPAPVEADPVVYSSGPDVTTHVAKDDLDDLRP